MNVLMERKIEQKKNANNAIDDYLSSEINSSHFSLDPLLMRKQ